MCISAVLSLSPCRSILFVHALVLNSLHARDAWLPSSLECMFAFGCSFFVHCPTQRSFFVHCPTQRMKKPFFRMSSASITFGLSRCRSIFLCMRSSWILNMLKSWLMRSRHVCVLVEDFDWWCLYVYFGSVVSLTLSPLVLTFHCWLEYAHYLFALLMQFCSAKKPNMSSELR